MLMEPAIAASADRGARTIAEALHEHATVNPQAPAIVFPNRIILSYGALQEQIAGIGSELERTGVGPGNRVGTVLPDGPEMAIVIAGIACNATAVPLNPNLTPAELDDLFVSQRLEAVVLADWVDTPAREVAVRHGVCRLEATRLESGVGLTLRTAPLIRPAESRAVGPDDAVLVLQTSGTTARPKLVVVTHRNLLAMATRLQSWFALTPSDRVLCVMPLYYAQGLKNALFTPLILGGSLACPSRSADSDFLTWLTELEPTWYSAGPALHRSVLERARQWQRGEFRHSLRFIQSAAAPIPDAVRDGLEHFFGVPVLDSYGLSEAGLVAANATAPDRRKRGTVGRPWRDELAIRGDDGRMLAAGELGEIVVQGPGVTPGYINDIDASRANFADGWFRTGDLGCIDTDGFLTVVGRIKELINRGGEKIAPAEIDDALLRHPAVAEAAVFPVPHPRLGEDVGAAVVLRPGEVVTSLELRRFLRTCLVPFKIPRRIHIVASLPKSDTGKIRRHELAGVFGAGPVARPPSTWLSSLEIEIAEIWQRLLERKSIGLDDEFFELGGDSLLAMQMLIEVERLIGRKLPDTILFETATIKQLTERVVQSEVVAGRGLLVEVQRGADRTPFIFVDGDLFGGGYYTRDIAQLLGPEQPFYNLRSHGLNGDRITAIEQMARDYLPLIAGFQPHGPYRLGGYCNGAIIAWELARQLAAVGERVELVVMIEPITLNARPGMRLVARALNGVLRLVAADPKRREARLGSTMSLVWRAIRMADRFLGEREAEADTRAGVDALAPRITKLDRPAAGASPRRLHNRYRRAMAGYFPSPVVADVLCLIAQAHDRSAVFAGHAWCHLTPRLRVAIVPGDHSTCITTHANALACQLHTALTALDVRDGKAARNNR
jgi:acyl-CoA synthetase (AMP-forming)/AMP-acid ligase II/thioesterase domain-containing protein/acyl carrier protein